VYETVCTLFLGSLHLNLSIQLIEFLENVIMFLSSGTQFVLLYDSEATTEIHIVHANNWNVDCIC
jgi:hypothetical protein